MILEHISLWHWVTDPIIMLTTGSFGPKDLTGAPLELLNTTFYRPENVSNIQYTIFSSLQR